MNPLLVRISAAALLVIFCGCARSPEMLRDRHLARGKALLQKRDYSHAVLEFRNAAKAMPKDAEAYYEIGVAVEGAGDLRSAILAFQKALSLNPNHAGAQLKLAQLMTLASDQSMLRDAEGRLDALKQSSPESADVLNSLAFAELKLGKTNEATENLEELLAKSPGELKSSILLARAKLQLHDPKGAEEVLQNACKVAPKSADARLALGDFYLSQQRSAEAEAEFRKALALDPKSGPGLMALGNLARSQGRKAEAEQIFKHLAVSGDTQYSPVYAQFLFEEGRREEAVREFEKLANQNPRDRMARTRLIEVYRAVNRSADAQKVLDQALQKNPRDLDALLQGGELSLAARNYLQAESYLNRALRIKPDWAEARYVRARLYQARGQTYLYRQELAEIVRLNPYLLAIRLEAAQSLIADQQGRAALEVLNNAPASQKKSEALLVQRNWALWEGGDLAEMRKGIDVGLSRRRSADFLLQDGLWKLRTGNASAARTAFEEALKSNPADLRALAGLNQTYVAQKQDAAGLERVKEYASRQPHSAPVQEFLGNLLMNHRDPNAASQAFAAAKTADPHFVDADFSLAQVDVINGKMGDARKRVEAILSVDPSNQTALLWLANLETANGDYKRATEHYRQIVQADSGNAEALNNLAYLLSEYGGQSDEALKYAQKAIELAPSNAEYRDTLGWVFYKKGLYRMAITELERAAAEGSGAVQNYHLAMAYTKDGDLKQAKAVLQTALARDPRLPEAKAAQELLARTAGASYAQ